ncbi:MAG: hypothetical protein ACE5HT_12835 [Gemmatimonadales bacterium]
MPLRTYISDDESGAISSGKLSLLLLAALALAVLVPFLLSRSSEAPSTVNDRANTPVARVPSPAISAELAPIRNMAQWADKLDQLRASGEEKALDIDERGSVAEPGSNDMREVVREWNLWSRDWLAALDSASSAFANAVDSTTDRSLALAHRRLTEALQELRLVPETADKNAVPRKIIMDSHFRIAANHIKAAREYLSRVGQ